MSFVVELAPAAVAEIDAVHVRDATPLSPPCDTARGNSPVQLAGFQAYDHHE